VALLRKARDRRFEGPRRATRNLREEEEERHECGKRRRKFRDFRRNNLAGPARRTTQILFHVMRSLREPGESLRRETTLRHVQRDRKNAGGRGKRTHLSSPCGEEKRSRHAKKKERIFAGKSYHGAKNEGSSITTTVAGREGKGRLASVLEGNRRGHY